MPYFFSVLYESKYKVYTINLSVEYGQAALLFAIDMWIKVRLLNILLSAMLMPILRSLQISYSFSKSIFSACAQMLNNIANSWVILFTEIARENNLLSVILNGGDRLDC